MTDPFFSKLLGNHLETKLVVYSTSRRESTGSDRTEKPRLLVMEPQ
jgi:hypothetical protein